MLDIYEVMFEINVKDEGFKRQIMKAPREILDYKFPRIGATNSKRP